MLTAFVIWRLCVLLKNVWFGAHFFFFFETRFGGQELFEHVEIDVLDFVYPKVSALGHC